MQAHVKMPHIKIDIRGDIHPKILSVLKEVYGKNVEIINNDKDEPVDVFQTGWFKKMNEEMTPGKNMKAYREIHKLTQEDLGKKLGGVSKQNISHMERGTRSISKTKAKLLAELFNVPVERFI